MKNRKQVQLWLPAIVFAGIAAVLLHGQQGPEPAKSAAALALPDVCHREQEYRELRRAHAA